MIQKHWRRFEQHPMHHDKTITQDDKREFEAYLGCGILSKVFVRLVCDSCKNSRLFWGRVP
jgi:hypothetical protein